MISIREEAIKNLFDELIETLLLRYNILFKMLSSKDKKTYRKTFKEDVSELSKQLQDVTTKAVSIIEDIDKVFSTQIPFKEPAEIDNRIQRVVDLAMPARSMFTTLEKEGKVSSFEINRNADLGTNVKVLANKIEEYNDNFDKKLLTFRQARQKYLSRLNETLDL